MLCLLEAPNLSFSANVVQKQSNAFIVLIARQRKPNRGSIMRKFSEVDNEKITLMGLLDEHMSGQKTPNSIWGLMYVCALRITGNIAFQRV